MIFRVIENESSSGWHMLAWGNQESDPRFAAWLKEQYGSRVTAKWRFNDGFPFWEVVGYDRDDMVFILMSWREDHENCIPTY